MYRFFQKYAVLIGLIAFLVALNLFFLFVGHERIVSFIGVENSYIIIFLIAAIGGLSSISGVAFFSLITTFAAGGSNPLLLGLVGGAGLFISDSIFYLLARYGRESIPPKWDRFLDSVERRVRRYPRWLVLVLSYLYLGFSPFPNDVLAVALVIGGYRYRAVAPIFLAGSLTHALFFSHIGHFLL